MSFVPTFSENLETLIVSVTFAYLIGSIPSGIIWAKFFKLGSLKNIGSGNIGATNVLRTGNKIAALLTLLCDAGKGFVAVFLAEMFTQELTIQAVCLFVFIGHCFPIWLKFKGGKGVATYIGIVSSINLLFGFTTCMIWLLSATMSRTSSLSALISAVFGPILVYFILDSSYLGISIALTFLIFWTHKTNIYRILNGTEPSINVTLK
ncbi:MAG: glycerol-3-phosphate 1-O-acyltransferase PlsY [Paracoccaceae bacterium]|nr:glycerol-3-phosphate 1-O-acyltransferase PlsY [Paracoccaceae bacterium]